MSRLALALAATVGITGCVGARAPLGSSVAATPVANLAAMKTDYKAFLDRGRTPSHVVDYVLKQGGFARVDLAAPPTKLSSGDRLAFVDRNRSMVLVVIGDAPVSEAGIRMIAAHIDTPGPRLRMAGVSRGSQTKIKTTSYGGTKNFQWQSRPLAIVGTVATDVGEIRVELGLQDDFAFWGTLGSDGEITLTTSSTPTGADQGFATLVGELSKRYGVTASDLESAELYAVPVETARDVGFDRSFVGAHGHDDRSNSYVAWRALLDFKKTPAVTAVSWLVDREEIGSTGPTGAQSQFLELVMAYLLRSSHEHVSEALLHKAFAATTILSSDTPACINPNWPEAHEHQNAPRAGAGPAVFPYTGSRGKVGGGAASGELIAKLRASFDRVSMPLQFGLLGHVDRGGGGTVAKYLAQRGAEVVDLGVCVISIHSPLELVAYDDLWSLYVGLKSWFGEKQ